MNFYLSEDVGKFIVRLMVSVLILFHGIGKVLHPQAISGIKRMLAANGLPEILAFGAYFGEVVGPIMILLGVFSRIGGALVVIHMLFAIGLAHMADIFALTDSGVWAIESQMFFLLSALAVMFLGSGRFALRED